LDKRSTTKGEGGQITMKSKATTVEEYLAEAPEEQRPALETLR
jgi:hypothetical protein